MANGDITKVIEYDKIEVVNSWAIQVRKTTKIIEEGESGVTKEISRSFHRHVLAPFNSLFTPAVEAVEAVTAVTEQKDSDGNVTREAVEAVTAVTGVDASWAHNATDLSGEAAPVQAIANAAWTTAVKNAYKAMREAQGQ